MYATEMHSVKIQFRYKDSYYCMLCVHAHEHTHARMHARAPICIFCGSTI